MLPSEVLLSLYQVMLVSRVRLLRQIPLLPSSFYSLSLADNLIVKLYADIAVFVPACHIQTIEVELAHAFEFLVNVEWRPHIDDMVADAWNHLHRAVSEDIDLTTQCQNFVLQECIANARQGFLGIFLRDVTCHDDHIGGILRFR